MKWPAARRPLAIGLALTSLIALLLLWVPWHVAEARIAYCILDGASWRITTQAGVDSNARPVPAETDLGCSAPALSPDGRSVAFEVSGKGVAVCSVSSGHCESIESQDGKLARPAWTNNQELILVNYTIGPILLLNSSNAETGADQAPIDKVALETSSFNPSLNEKARLAYSLSQPQHVTVRVYDPDGGLVATLLDSVHQEAGDHQLEWTGVDLEGRLVPDEAYSFTIETGSRAVYDPSTFSGGLVGDITTAEFDRSAGTVSYSLPASSRVLIRLGIQSGPMLRTLVDWKPRLKGSVTEFWDGYDENNTIPLSATKNFTALITYVTFAGSHRHLLWKLERILPRLQTGPRQKPDRLVALWILTRFADPEARIHFIDPFTRIAYGKPFDIPEAETRRGATESATEALVTRLHLETDPHIEALAGMTHVYEITRWTLPSQPEVASLGSRLMSAASGCNDGPVEPCVDRAMVFLDHWHGGEK